MIVIIESYKFFNSYIKFKDKILSKKMLCLTIIQSSTQLILKVKTKQQLNCALSKQQILAYKVYYKHVKKYEYKL